MNARITIATAARVLLQLRRDPRTIALLLVVSCLLEVLLRYVLDGLRAGAATPQDEPRLSDEQLREAMAALRRQRLGRRREQT